MNEDLSQNGSVISLPELLAIIYRRRWWIMVPTLIGILVALAIALLMTPAYRSQATLLIDSPQIPTSFAPVRPA